MDDYDSDSSGSGDVETNVLLGYASNEPTSDDFSQLGGHPIWMDLKTAPSGKLATCKVCNGLMSLLFQLNADLPDRFSSHERRLYILGCRNKACRRKNGSIRGLRSVRASAVPAAASKKEDKAPAASKPEQQPSRNVGEALFGVKSSGNASANPFSTGSGSSMTNPFASPSTQAAKPAEKPMEKAAESLPETFAQKAQISSPPPTETAASESRTSWPEKSEFPAPYPAYYVDADKEYLEAESQEVPSNARVDESADGEGGASGDMKGVFESSMDKIFQKFADRVSQNPEQILRYEYAGQPLLYSKTDAAGKLLSTDQDHSAGKVQVVSQSGAISKMPKCTNCGAARTFECQLTPHAIAELEADEMGLDGMEWGTIILGVCTKDCLEKGVTAGQVGYVDEWVGVQWEELTDHK